MKLSVVTTLYCSANQLDEFYQRISSAVQKRTRDYEIIYVNDGSPDQSLNIALQQQKTDSHVVIIDLSRNFGHHQAGFEGLKYSQGDLVFLIDSDLEEAPELFNDFWQKYHQDEAVDVVYGVQKTRKGKFFERVAGGFFYRVFNYLSDLKIPQNILTIRLMSRRYVDALLNYQEYHLFLGGLMCHVGFEQRPLVVDKLSKGERTYSLRHQLKLLTIAISAFSVKPLYFILLLGLVMLASSIIFAVIMLGYHVFFHTAWQNIHIILLTMTFLAGILMTGQGILGLYLANVFDEVKKRPRAIVKKVYQVS